MSYCVSLIVYQCIRISSAHLFVLILLLINEPMVSFESLMMQKHNRSINKMDESNPYSLGEQTIGHTRTHTNTQTAQRTLQGYSINLLHIMQL